VFGCLCFSGLFVCFVFGLFGVLFGCWFGGCWFFFFWFWVCCFFLCGLFLGFFCGCCLVVLCVCFCGVCLVLVCWVGGWHQPQPKTTNNQKTPHQTNKNQKTTKTKKKNTNKKTKTKQSGSSSMVNPPNGYNPPVPAKTQGVADLPSPQRHRVQSFLGSLGSPVTHTNYSEIVRPLLDLTRKPPWHWDKQQKTILRTSQNLEF